MDGNPLRRGVDRAERALWILLGIAFFVLVPIVAPLAGHAARSAGLTEVKVQSSWREVNATLARRAPPQFYGYNSQMTVWVPGHWRAPSGAERTGLLPAKPSTPAGSHVKIWVDRAGQMTGRRPLTAGGLGVRIAVIESLAASALAVALLMLAWLVRWISDRRRMAYWGIEWACFGPRWSARHK